MKERGSKKECEHVAKSFIIKNGLNVDIKDSEHDQSQKWKKPEACSTNYS